MCLFLEVPDAEMDLDVIMSSVRSVSMPELDFRGRMELSLMLLVRSTIIVEPLYDSWSLTS